MCVMTGMLARVSNCRVQLSEPDADSKALLQASSVSDDMSEVRHFDIIPQPARLTIPGLPSEAKVYVNNTVVTLPHQLKHGTYPVQQETTFAPVRLYPYHYLNENHR